MDYSNEPRGVFFLIDNKSFYASVEATMRNLNPLTVPLVVMSEQENTNGGLILATSPMAKKMYHLKANVSRQRNLPQDPNLMVVPPRMNLYIKRNLQINDIFRRFVADEDLFPYSIDESILDLTHSWQLFGSTPVEVAKLIQRTVRKELGLYVTVGIGDNPVQAKIALDIYAKHTDNLIGEIHYETVPERIWSINDLTDVWGIGSRMALRLNRLGIHNMDELAHTSPFYIKEKLGIIGTQLFATAWGIDRTSLHKRLKPKEASIGNSQVLPRDYNSQTEIETVIKELGEQVGARLRHHNKQAGVLYLGIGFSYLASEDDGRGGFSHSMKIAPTNNNRQLVSYLIQMFRDSWQGQTIRNVAVYTSKLSNDVGEQLSIFFDPKKQIKKANTDRILDSIRNQFGFTSLVYARSLTEGGTAINRASLVGGHNGGNAYE
ncbi:excinuclease ABC subunit A [Lentilactobacillus curieae]|uniref:Excinuclease ABC subunit A n=1 Tax=Lentilactobacillus curieae TaxID=1138822 RepID=A0A1S6QGB6_9LACO|nr:Y-family DNA polymerase [Lentilactobacillus curieae]AQW20648.1 excinuclease ABC subunit A [Lentilactobacillus curieae]